ncbi:BAG family molecular chaperone regulator 5 [Galemys pyrenaicus]|uniref:BAG family molecular chaperone regulator 5 n=1 Tax=Galemys pyrenaicus TaxID=202257 RepID=A0A8J6ARN8_GALPY|nr:BAG family molecular chaperone regulator 5 [Galemys pyrenaicus]
MHLPLPGFLLGVAHQARYCTLGCFPPHIPLGGMPYALCPGASELMSVSPIPPLPPKTNMRSALWLWEVAVPSERAAKVASGCRRWGWPLHQLSATELPRWDIQRGVKSIEQQVSPFSGLPDGTDYKTLERMLTKEHFEIDSIDMEGREILSKQTRGRHKGLPLLKKILPFYSGGNCVTDEFEDGIQANILRLTSGNWSEVLRKARLHHTLEPESTSLPLTKDAHPSPLAKANLLLWEVIKARGTVVTATCWARMIEACRRFVRGPGADCTSVKALDACRGAEIRNYQKVDENTNK